jgi:hypothetical protein
MAGFLHAETCGYETETRKCGAIIEDAVKRWGLIAVVGVAGSGLAVGALVRAGGGSTRPRSATVAAVRFVFPGRFDRRYFSSCRYRVTGVRGACVRGVVVASYPLTSNPELGAGAPFRHGGVVLELYRAPGQGPNVIASTVLPPLSLSDFHFVGRGIRPSTEQSELFFRARGANYWAIAWVGKRAAKSDRGALASVVASIRIG